MGNSPSAVEQRVEHGSKTGVCSLRELKLERVNGIIFKCVCSFSGLCGELERCLTIKNHKKIVVSAP